MGYAGDGGGGGEEGGAFGEVAGFEEGGDGDGDDVRVGDEPGAIGEGEPEDFDEGM